MIRNKSIETFAGSLTLAVRQGTSDGSIVDDVCRDDCYRVREMRVERERPLVIDIGANIGAFGALANSVWPDCEIYSYEPHPLNFGLLSYNLRETRGRCYLGAVQGTERPQQFIVNRCSDESSQFGGWGVVQRPTEWHANEKTEAGIECDFFDPEECLFPARRGDRPVIVKLDCEASEFNIMERWSEETLMSIDYLVGEIHTNALEMDYFDGCWDALRTKLLTYFHCLEVESRPSVSGELFNFFAKAKRRER